MSKKMKNLGSCTSLWNVRGEHFDKVMCDLGSKISLMLMCLAITCGIHRDLKPTRIYIQLVDKLVVKTKGIIDDILVRVDKFIIPMDFIVMDVEKDKDIPLIFGRPFVATGDVVIGLKERTMTFCVKRQEVMFDAKSTHTT